MIKFAFSRIYLIFLWSLLAATVGLILRIIEQTAERVKGIGGLIIHYVNSLLGLMWSIITIFVVPSMVYKNLGPIDAIKNSVSVLKKTWGESLIRYIGLGLAELLFIVLGVIGFIILFIVGLSIGPFGILIVLIMAIIYFLGVILIFGIANSVFNTALYVYAETGKVPGEYNETVIKNAFKPKGSKTII